MLLKKSDWVSFVMNFLAVVLGIVITFIAEGMISRHNETKRAKEILTLIKDELVEDVEGIKFFGSKDLDKSRAAEYLLSHSDNVKAIPDDSLIYYGSLVTNPLMIVMNNVAAGLMQSEDFQNGIKDNELKLDISEAYVLLDGIKESYNMNASAVMDLVNQAQNEEFRRKTERKDITEREIYEAMLFSADGIYMLRSARGDAVKNVIEASCNSVEQIIEKIDRHL